MTASKPQNVRFFNPLELVLWLIVRTSIWADVTFLRIAYPPGPWRERQIARVRSRRV